MTISKWKSLEYMMNFAMREKQEIDKINHSELRYHAAVDLSRKYINKAESYARDNNYQEAFENYLIAIEIGKLCMPLTSNNYQWNKLYVWTWGLDINQTLAKRAVDNQSLGDLYNLIKDIKSEKPAEKIPISNNIKQNMPLPQYSNNDFEEMYKTNQQNWEREQQAKQKNMNVSSENQDSYIPINEISSKSRKEWEKEETAKIRNEIQKKLQNKPTLKSRYNY